MSLYLLCPVLSCADFGRETSVLLENQSSEQVLEAIKSLAHKSVWTVVLCCDKIVLNSSTLFECVANTCSDGRQQSFKLKCSR